MSTVEVLQGQTLIDLSIQEFGGPDVLFDFANANAIGITDDLTLGSFLGLPIDDLVSRKVWKALSDRNIKPASAVEEAVIGPGGLGYMGIQIDFNVH